MIYSTLYIAVNTNEKASDSSAVPENLRAPARYGAILNVAKLLEYVLSANLLLIVIPPAVYFSS